MNLFDTQEELLYLIENKRSEMVLVASRTGFLSHQTLKTSKELDELLNLHYQLWGI
ncbi:aspartyl-phosphate phosphatase Spo0E family protein [Bacillus sp. 1NLA3E]|uniref:aspartyl-phosphate phosphatase Spo0E family protein n=1 Tax=Bacillus sp. 1NLA3E TaxID=666686 RepID=UPI000247EF35|nr:aspartyl-phosphate phosphatase Spo0E family protein [Bacillus sp. 1NLA3E]